MDLGKAAGNQHLLAEVIQVVTEETRGLVGLFLCTVLYRALLISNSPHLWRQKTDSGPLRIKNMALLDKACRSLCWGPTAGHLQRYWSLAALLGLRTPPGLSWRGCSELLMVLCNLALVQVCGCYHECENGPSPLREGAGQPCSAPAVGCESWRGQQREGSGSWKDHHHEMQLEGSKTLRVRRDRLSLHHAQPRLETGQAGVQMLPAPSQVGSAAVKHYPNILPPLSALVLPPIISLPFSELLLRLQLLTVIDGTSRKGTRVRQGRKERRPW